MQSLKMLALCAFVILFVSCEDENGDDIKDGTFGTFDLEFDHVVGDAALVLATDSNTFDYETASGQLFNVSKFRYYVTSIQLEGEDGIRFLDPMNVSADADKVTGYYLVIEGDDTSKLIELKNVPSGKYNKVTFTIGVSEDGVQEGAVGGVLDPGNGAWFWTWNSGYVSFGIEGGFHASSHEARVTHGAPGAFSYHVGGWKDIPAVDEESQIFVNNMKTIAIDFDTDLIVSPKHEPNAHLVVDILKVLDGAKMDFNTTPNIHTPAAGKIIADQFEKAFLLDHVHP